jgi:hypothetical protein
VADAAPRDEVSGLRAANLALRFLLELAALAALSYWGFHTGTTLLSDVLLGVGAPLVAAVVWGTFAAPKSSRRLRGPALIALQMAVFAAGVAALAATGQELPAVVLAVVVAANAVLMHVWGQS